MYALKGESGKVMGKTNNQPWVAITTLTLFIAMLFCNTVAAADERVCVTSKIANVRSGPGTNHETLWQMEMFYPLLILEKKGNWIKFKDFEGDSGWIHKSLVGNIPSVITVKSNCNVRSGPGPGNAIVFTVERGVPFKVLEKQGNWLEIEHGDGDRGWIYKPLVW